MHAAPWAVAGPTAGTGEERLASRKGTAVQVTCTWFGLLTAWRVVSEEELLLPGCFKSSGQKV